MTVVYENVYSVQKKTGSGGTQITMYIHDVISSIQTLIRTTLRSRLKKGRRE